MSNSENLNPQTSAPRLRHQREIFLLDSAKGEMMRGAGIREGERTSSFVAGGKLFTFFFFFLALLLSSSPLIPLTNWPSFVLLHRLSVWTEVRLVVV